MKVPAWLGIFVAALVLFCSCGKKNGVRDQLGQLENAFPAATDSAGKTAEQTPPTDPAAYVRLALASAQSNDFAGSVIALQSVKQMPTITPGQLKAVQGVMQSMTMDLVARAARGDAQAKADLAAIERTRSQ